MNFTHLHPITFLLGKPYLFNYTDPIFAELPIRDTVFMQAWNEEILRKNNAKWGIAGYLEDRSLRLRGTKLIDEWRIYHLGIDIIAPTNTLIYSPLEGEVIESTVELWKANYWGYVIISYPSLWDGFCILYGHLDPDSLHSLGTIWKWDSVGSIWSPAVNGEWTTHLHMQAFTGKDIEKWKSKWYCSIEDLPTIRDYCPDPSFLIRY